MKNLILSFSLFAGILSPALSVASDCPSAGQVTYCGIPGTSTSFGWDTLSLIEALERNPTEYQKLLEGGYRLADAKVEIVAAENPNRFFDTRQFTLTGRFIRSPMSSPDSKKDRILVLRAKGIKGVMDASVDIWESSGVSEVK